MPVIIPITGATTIERVAENSIQVELTDASDLRFPNYHWVLLGLSTPYSYR